MTTAKTVGGAATRQAVIDASYTLFTARGYHATSMRDIAAATGITAGSIYNHFADKEQIVQEVLLAYHPFMKVLPVLEEVEGQTVSLASPWICWGTSPASVHGGSSLGTTRWLSVSSKPTDWHSFSRFCYCAMPRPVRRGCGISPRWPSICCWGSAICSFGRFS